MKIQEIELTDEHIGSPVTYIPDHAESPSHPDAERGVISSFNESGVWVRFKSATGEKCSPDKLVWG